MTFDLCLKKKKKKKGSSPMVPLPARVALCMGVGEYSKELLGIFTNVKNLMLESFFWGQVAGCLKTIEQKVLGSLILSCIILYN